MTETLFRIHAFEGARGTSHRIRPICNIEVVDGSSRDTTYGWEGEKEVVIVDPSQVAAWHDVKDDVKSHHEIYIITPSGDWYRQTRSNSICLDQSIFPLWYKRGEFVPAWDNHKWIEVKEEEVPPEVLQVVPN